jgi:hypothetical protein
MPPTPPPDDEPDKSKAPGDSTASNLRPLARTMAIVWLLITFSCLGAMVYIFIVCSKIDHRPRPPESTASPLP